MTPNTLLVQNSWSAPHAVRFPGSPTCMGVLGSISISPLSSPGHSLSSELQIDNILQENQLDTRRQVVQHIGIQS